MLKRIRESNLEAAAAQVMWILAMIAGVITVLVLVVDVFVHPVNKALNIRTTEGTVIGKTAKHWLKARKYLVEIENEDGETEMFEVTNSLFRWRFDAAETWDGIEIGKTYEFEIGGVKLPVMPWYPNIYGYEEVPN